MVVEHGRVRTPPAELATAFPAGTPARIVIEVGTHSPWVSRLLQAGGHEVVVANARRVRLVAENNRKDDRTDAEQLARLGRLDPGLLAPIRHRGEQAQRDLAVLRASSPDILSSFERQVARILAPQERPRAPKRPRTPIDPEALFEHRHIIREHRVWFATDA